MKGILWAVLTKELPVDRLFECGEPHHCTLQFGVERSEWESLIGLEFEGFVVADHSNHEIQAVSITLPAGIPCRASHPHITVSYRAGVSPVKSNELLLNPDRSVPVGVAVALRVEFLEWVK